MLCSAKFDVRMVSVDTLQGGIVFRLVSKLTEWLYICQLFVACSGLDGGDSRSRHVLLRATLFTHDDGVAIR